MPAESKQQQKAMGLALAARRGEKDPEDLTGSAKEIYNSDMSTSDIEDYASTSHEDKPEKKEDNGDNKKKGSEDNILNQFLRQRQQKQESVHKQAEEVVNHRLRKIAQDDEESYWDKAGDSLQDYGQDVQDAASSGWNAAQAGGQFAKNVSKLSPVYQAGKQIKENPEMVENAAQTAAQFTTGVPGYMARNHEDMRDATQNVSQAAQHAGQRAKEYYTEELPEEFPFGNRSWSESSPAVQWGKAIKGWLQNRPGQPVNRNQ